MQNVMFADDTKLGMTNENINLISKNLNEDSKNLKNLNKSKRV